MNLAGGGTFRQIPSPTASEKAEQKSAAHSDAAARKEALFLARGFSADALKRQAEHNEHTRNEAFRDEFERMAIWGLRLFCGGVLVMVGCWIWHLVMPPEEHWLSAEQLNKIQSLATGGIIASIATGHFKRRLGGN